jgi:hypothetical protein
MNSILVVGKMSQVSLFPRTLSAITANCRRPATTAPLLMCVAFAFGVLSIPLFGQPSDGLVGGVTRDSITGAPVEQVQIVAHNMTTGANRAAVTGADGIFTITNLEPGVYEVEATKHGYQESTTDVVVWARQTARINVALKTTADLRAPKEKSDDAPLTAREKQLLDRLERLEQRLASMEAKAVSAAPPAGFLWPSAPKTTPSDEYLVASLSPVATATPQAPSPQTPEAPPPAQTPAPQQSGGRAGPIATPPTTVAPPEHRMPDALQAPDAAPAVDNDTPFAFGDISWLNGSARTKDTVLDTKFFTPEIRFDTHYMEDFNQPIDHTIVGSTESFRSGEVQIEQASVGGDFHWQNVRGRILFMDGLFATTTPRNDASSATGSGNGNTGGVGQWDLQNAYKYVSEAYGGYHFNVQHGLNVDAGIFVSYIGLFSYYNFDNWAYQPSYVSSNTPWFFNGVRVQWFPTNKLKIEPWFINGWQSYAKYNGHPGLGGQLLWLPKEWFKLVANQYGYGEDNLGLPKTQRIHTDDSIEVRYYSNPETQGISKMAFSLTGDAGCQYGGGITCHGGPNKSAFLGWMLYDRMWFHKDLYAITVGGGHMTNPGRYLTLLPPIDGAWAASGTPYFTESPGQPAHMWDSTVTFHYMPRQYITWWAEVGYRHSDVPYFAGRGGVTPPGGNNGDPQYYTCMSGATAGTAILSAAETACGGGLSSVWFPDLRRSEAKVSVGVMVKF